jgi:hypothetical protein
MARTGASARDLQACTLGLATAVAVLVTAAALVAPAWAVAVNVVAWGSFTTPSSRVAQWNGAAWSALGGGVSDDVSAGTMWQGRYCLGGRFLTAYSPGAVTVNRVACWDGAAWTALVSDTGVRGTNNDVRALTTYQGALVVAGLFTAPATRIAGWNGTAWTAYGAGLSGGSNEVLAVAVVQNGALLVAGGEFSNSGSTALPGKLAQWDGAQWLPLEGGGVDAGGVVRTLSVVNGATLAVGGAFTQVGALTVSGLALWTAGLGWTAPTPLDGVGVVLAVVPYAGSLAAGGIFGGANYNYFAYLSAADGQWDGVGANLNERINGLSPSADGSVLLMAGEFTIAGGRAAASVAAWNGTAYSALGSGVANGKAFGIQSICVQLDDRCSDCVPGRYGADCNASCAVCNGNCTQGLNGTCACFAGFVDPPQCNQCAADYYGASCAPCAACRGQCFDGITGNCTCAVGFVNAPSCDVCAAGYYGPSCAPCAACNGTCIDGNDGTCTCPLNYQGPPSCADCASGYYGPSCVTCAPCNGTCVGGIGGACVCGIGRINPPACANCQPNYYGSGCAWCGDCAIHGTCVPGDLGYCKCDGGWTGTTCAQCGAGWYGVNCDVSCSTCTNGVCISGTNGSCVCNTGWTGGACAERSAWVIGTGVALGILAVVAVVGLIFLFGRRIFFPARTDADAGTGKEPLLAPAAAAAVAVPQATTAPAPAMPSFLVAPETEP